MGPDAPTDVVTDTSTLVNFLRVGRVDLLAGLTSYRFVVTDHVRAEVMSSYPAQLSKTTGGTQMRSGKDYRGHGYSVRGRTQIRRDLS